MRISILKMPSRGFIALLEPALAARATNARDPCGSRSARRPRGVPGPWLRVSRARARRTVRCRLFWFSAPGGCSPPRSRVAPVALAPHLPHEQGASRKFRVVRRADRENAARACCAFDAVKSISWSQFAVFARRSGSVRSVRPTRETSCSSFASFRVFTEKSVQLLRG